MKHPQEHLQSAALLIAGPNSLLNGAVAAATQANNIKQVRIASSTIELLHTLHSWSPTVVALDIEFAVADGFQTIRAIQKSDPTVRIIVLASDDEDPRVLTDCFIIGIDGVASKDRGIESLLTVLEVVHRGDRAVPRWITDSLIDVLREVAVPKSAGIQLSTRQKEVLRLVAEGLTDRDIGERLHISPTTVRSHLAAIFEKTSTDNRTAAARWLQSIREVEIVQNLHD